MKKLLLVLFAITAGLNGALSQTANYSGLTNISYKSFNPIVVNDEIKGYYMFYMLDKVSRSENKYALNILDNNLKQTHYVEFQKRAGFKLLESAFNGETFCFMFHNSFDNTIEYSLFDKNGKESGKYSPQFDQQQLSFIGLAYQPGQASISGKGAIIEVPGKGFIMYSGNKTEMFDNEGKVLWESENPKSEHSSGSYPLYANETAFFSFNYEAISMLKRRLFMQINDTRTGELIKRFELWGGNRQLMPLGVSYDEETREFLVYGEYFKPDVKVYKAIREGFFVQSFNKNGEMTKESYSSWTKDIGTKIAMNSKGKLDKGMRVFIHKMVKTADGKYFAIGEQYKKTLDPVALATLGYVGGAMFKIVLRDMMIFEFDKDFNITKVHSIDKSKSNIYLMRGFGVNGPGVLAYYSAAMGWFNYSYTTMGNDQKTFNTSYVSRVKVDGKKRNVVGNASYTKEKEISTDRIVIKDKPTSFYVMPAKPGYVAIFKYYRKKKKLDAALEKLNL